MSDSRITEQARLDSALSEFIDIDSRHHLWDSASAVLESIDNLPASQPKTGLVLGYVQSGKTTAMTSLMALAADRGYTVIVALLGSTNLLLGQNASRITKYLGIATRSDYSWVTIPNPKGKSGAKEISEWLEKGRKLFIPVLKHSGRIDDIRKIFEAIPSLDRHNVLIVDDEADQASLNTEVRKGTESRVYASIDGLRNSIEHHAFVQFTATPYAPLLLEPEDPLFPRFVQFLEPGRGYTGGREFFIDFAESAVRFIPSGDEQLGSKLPIELPESLIRALWSFIIGSSIMMETIPDSPPISMLIHSSHRNDVQERYHFLLSRMLRELNQEVLKASALGELPLIALKEVDRFSQLGVAVSDEPKILSRIKYVVGEVKLWLLNSATAVKTVDWNVSPIHILVGGNKLDRGFTVEGLTVTYMNRPASEQLDTIEQRARAFGYRSEFLPFCQFFGTARTIKVLREIVFTEYDLRAKMQDYVDAGKSIAEWAKEIGLLIPGGSKPTRDAVVRELSRYQFGWHQLRRPVLESQTIESNWNLSNVLGIFSAPLKTYGRLSFRTLELPSSTVFSDFLTKWQTSSYSPDWRSDDLFKQFERAMVSQPTIEIILIEQDAESENPRQRIRRWTEQEGFINLFQGRDLDAKEDVAFYEGDRSLGVVKDNPEKLQIQIHRVTRRGYEDDVRLLTLALHLGDKQIIEKSRQ